MTPTSRFLWYNFGLRWWYSLHSSLIQRCRPSMTGKKSWLYISVVSKNYETKKAPLTRMTRLKQYIVTNESLIYIKLQTEFDKINILILAIYIKEIRVYFFLKNPYLSNPSNNTLSLFYSMDIVSSIGQLFKYCDYFKDYFVPTFLLWKEKHLLWYLKLSARA